MFTKTKDSDTQMSSINPAQDAVKSAASKPTARSAASIICGDMEIHGSITSEGALQIDGLVDGDVSAADITIGAGGTVIGEVKAKEKRQKRKPGIERKVKKNSEKKEKGKRKR